MQKYPPNTNICPEEKQQLLTEILANVDPKYKFSIGIFYCDILLLFVNRQEQDLVKALRQRDTQKLWDLLSVARKNNYVSAVVNIFFTLVPTALTENRHVQQCLEETKEAKKHVWNMLEVQYPLLELYCNLFI